MSIAAKMQTESSLAEMEHYRRDSNNALALAGIIYLYNLIDAYFLGSTESLINEKKSARGGGSINVEPESAFARGGAPREGKVVIQYRFLF